MLAGSADARVRWAYFNLARATGRLVDVLHANVPRSVESHGTHLRRGLKSRVGVCGFCA